MKTPEEALAAARRAARAGATPGGDSADGGLPPWSVEGAQVSARRLAEWAIIEPDPTRVYSTRRLGRPITAVKLLLVRLLGQYIGQVSAQQSRFNAHVAAHVMRLEERVAELEARGPVGDRATAGRTDRAPTRATGDRQAPGR